MRPISPKIPVAQRAFVRSLEIIGKASKQVDPELRAKYIEWTKSTWNYSTKGEVSHTRDALGRIVTLERKAGQYALYPGGGIHQSFGYTSRGELESANTMSLETPATALPGRSVALSYDGQGNQVMGVAEDPGPLLTTEETCQMARISGI